MDIKHIDGEGKTVVNTAGADARQECSHGGHPGSSSTATQVKTFKFRADQIKTVQAAIDRAKEVAGAEHDTAALANHLSALYLSALSGRWD